MRCNSLNERAYNQRIQSEGDGALTPGANAEFRTSEHNVNKTASCLSMNNCIFCNVSSKGLVVISCSVTYVTPFAWASRTMRPCCQILGYLARGSQHVDQRQASV